MASQPKGLALLTRNLFNRPFRLPDVAEQLEAVVAHFRSLRDPIDTSTPQGIFSLQVLGAVVQLQRARIAGPPKARV